VDLPTEPVDAPPPDPAWNVWDVLRIVLMGVVSLFIAVVVLLLVLPGPLRTRANMLNARPELQIVGQMGAYILWLGYMYVLVTKERRRPRFWEAIHWNWPSTPQWYLFLGVVLQLSVLVFEFLLKRFLPRETPFAELLRHPLTLLLITGFSVTLGPLMEELFFRGFLYPWLRGRIGAFGGARAGVWGAVVVTALGFGLLHAAQYGNAWVSVAVIFLVGVVLALVREIKNSVGAGFLVHVGYNGTIMMLLFLATDGFRHLENLNK
jgi:membrane protease YdiL (CAAX protease family)